MTSGLVLDKAGRQCRTTEAVDEAMRATRAFWQDEPVVWEDAQWEELLSQYSPPPFAKCTLPIDDDLLRAVVRSPDSAPGLDGLPYAAYRTTPNAASRVLTHRLHDYVGLQAPAPVQALVFIPKADAGSYADNFRPLGLPNTAVCVCNHPVRLLSIFSGNPREISWICRPTLAFFFRGGFPNGLYST